MTIFASSRVVGWVEWFAKIAQQHTSIGEDKFFRRFPKGQREDGSCWDVGRKRLSISVCDLDSLGLAVGLVKLFN